MRARASLRHRDSELLLSVTEVGFRFSSEGVRLGRAVGTRYENLRRVPHGLR